MKLYELIQSYNFDEIMPEILRMFPGTAKYREPLKQAYDILLEMRPVPSKKSVRYRFFNMDNSDESYMVSPMLISVAPGRFAWERMWCVSAAST